MTQIEIDSYKTMYNQVNPDVTVEAVAFPQDQYMTKLQAALRSGVGIPDVMLFEIKDFGQLKDTDYLENLSAAPYSAEDYAKDQIPYVAELSRDKAGNLKGLSYQSCPGGYWYNKKLAQEYLGVSEPAEVQALISDWDKIAETGKMVYEKSGGKVALLDSYRSVTGVMLDMREGAYVDENGKLYDHSLFRNCFETAKTLRDVNADAKLEQWTAGWNTAFYSEPSFIVLGMPSWGLHYCIKANTPEDATDTDDTWGFCEAPNAYQSGGTWVAMYSGSENKEAAWDYVKTTTVDTRYLELYVQKTGDMVGYKPAIEKIIADGFRDPFLGDQDIYDYMYKAAMNVTPKPMSAYDDQVVSAFQNTAELLLDGQLDVDGAMDTFLKDLKSQFPDIDVE